METLLKQATSNTIKLAIATTEKNFTEKFNLVKNEAEKLSLLIDELTLEKKNVTNKFYLSLRKEIRLTIIALNSEILKGIKKDELKKVVINKIASDKQSSTIGLNKLVQQHNKSLGKCISTLLSVYTDVKESPKQEKEFVFTSYKVNKITLNYEEINTTYKVKFCPITFDILGYSRKNSDLYSFISLLFTSDELTKLTERKVMNVLNANLPKIQETKAKIKETLKVKK